jgi:hypothetical protein
MFRFWLGALFFIVIFNRSYGQVVDFNDTLDYERIDFDTVYLKPDTLFIIDTVIHEVEEEFEYSNIIEPFYSRTISLVEVLAREKGVKQPTFAYSSEFGVNYHFNIKQLLVRTGLGINTLKCRYDFSTSILTQRRTQSFFDTVEVSYEDLPDTPFNDSIPKYVVNVEYLSYFDTMLISSPYQCNYTYLMIPLYVSYPVLKRQNSILYIDAGLVARIYVSSSDLNLLENNGNLLLISKNEINSFNFDMRYGLSYIVLLNESTDLSFSPFFSLTAASLINRKDFNLKLRDIGIRIGYVKYF